MATLLFRDVIEHIASHLQHDKTSLARLRLVNHTWDVPCRALLFYKIELKALDPLDYLYMYDDAHPHGFGAHDGLVESATQDLLDQCNTLLDLFRARPCLGNVPREVVLMRAHRLKPSIWGTLEPAYTKVLEHLRCIHKIHLREVHFAHLSKAFVGALLGVCRQPTVTHFNLVNCPIDDGGLLKEVIFAPKFLKHLALSGAPSKKHGPAKARSDSHQSERGGGKLPASNELTSHTSTPCNLSPPLCGRVRLETLALSVSSASTFVEHLLHSSEGMELSELKGFRIGHVDGVTASPEDMEALIVVFMACASSVEFLENDSPSGGCKASKEDILRCTRLVHLPRLRTVRFTGVRFTEKRSQYPFLITVLRLSTINPASELRTLDIHAYIDSTVVNDVDWECWQKIDGILSNEKSFPFFGTLMVSLTAMDMGRASVLISLLKQRLPIISGSGRLSVSVTL